MLLSTEKLYSNKFYTMSERAVLYIDQCEIWRRLTALDVA